MGGSLAHVFLLGGTYLKKILNARSLVSFALPRHLNQHDPAAQHPQIEHDKMRLEDSRRGSDIFVKGERQKVKVHRQLRNVENFSQRWILYQ